MTGAPAVAPVDVVAKLSTTLGEHHAPHLLPGVLACLAPHLRPYPSEGGRRTVDAVAVCGLVALLNADGRPDLITRVLLAVTPWLPDPAAPVIPPAPPAGAALTGHQTEMLHLVSYGCTNGEIGRKVGLHEDTVKTHLRGLRHALGARDRAHAVRLGLECGALKADSADTD